jgi:hypothetical protein
VIVRVAVLLGRSILDVARDSFALTRYTLWQHSQYERIERFTRETERHDMAKLAVFAFHKPSDLSDAHGDFLSRIRADRIDATVNETPNETRLARAIALVALHATMVPIDPPDRNAPDGH